jgi:hypothetical protein
MQIPSYAVRPPSSPTGSAPLTDPAQPSLEAVVGTVAALSGKRRFASPDDAPAEQDKVLWSEPVRQALEQHRAERPHGRKDDARAKRRSDPRGDRGGERGGEATGGATRGATRGAPATNVLAVALAEPRKGTEQPTRPKALAPRQMRSRACCGV